MKNWFLKPLLFQIQLVPLRDERVCRKLGAAVGAQLKLTRTLMELEIGTNLGPGACEYIGRGDFIFPSLSPLSLSLSHTLTCLFLPLASQSEQLRACVRACVCSTFRQGARREPEPGAAVLRRLQHGRRVLRQARQRQGLTIVHLHALNQLFFLILPLKQPR